MTRKGEPSRESSASSLDPAYYEALGRAVQVLRVERGLHRKELAERSGVSYPYLSEIENGKKRPSSESLLALATALEVRPSELMERAEDLRGTAPPRPSDPPFEGMAVAHAWAEPAPAPSLPPMPYGERNVPPPTRNRAPSADRADPLEPAADEGQSWVRMPRRRVGHGQIKSFEGTGRTPEAGELIRQLLETASTLPAEDLQRLIDLARRLAT